MELDLTLEAFASTTHEKLDRIGKRVAPRRFLTRTLTQYGVTIAGVIYAVMGRPAAGRLWTLTSIACIGPNTGGAGSFSIGGTNRVAVCVGSFNPGTGAGFGEFGSMTDVRACLDAGTGGSGVNNLTDQFGIDAIWCQDSEDIYLMHASSQAAQAVTYNVCVREYAYDDIYPRDVV